MMFSREVSIFHKSVSKDVFIFLFIVSDFILLVFCVSLYFCSVFLAFSCSLGVCYVVLYFPSSPHSFFVLFLGESFCCSTTNALVILFLSYSFLAVRFCCCFCCGGVHRRRRRRGSVLL